MSLRSQSSKTEKKICSKSAEIPTSFEKSGFIDFERRCVPAGLEARVLRLREDGLRHGQRQGG